MKIALVDPSLFTLPYDAALSRGLRSAEHEVRLYGKVAAGGEAALADGLRPHFYRSLERLPWRNAAKPIYQIAKGISHIAGMERFCSEMARFRPDVIHFQWLPLPSVDAWFLRRLRRIAPVVITVHDTMPFNGAPGSSLQSLGAFKALRVADALIVHTEKGRGVVAGQVGQEDRVICVPHGLLHEPGPMAADALAPPSAAPAPRLPLQFLLFGKLKPYKGLDVLIRAVARLDAQTRQGCRVKVVGKAYMDMEPLHGLARELGVADLFDFDLRFVSTDELEAILRAADVLVFPYRAIEASGVLMSAITVGKPVIATRMGAAEELFSDGQGGTLIPPEDPGALAAAMRGFIAVPERVTACAAHVRRMRAAIPSWSEIGHRTTAVYDLAARHWRARPPSRSAAARRSTSPQRAVEIEG